MPIKPSAAAEIRSLVDALSSADDVRREIAIARLAIIGPRAVDRLVAAATHATRETRMAILRTLEGIGDARALPVALEGLGAGGDVGVTAAATLRSLLDHREGTVAAQALDALVSTAVGPDVERRVRLAALEALRGMPLEIRARIDAALGVDAQRTGGEHTDALASEVASLDAVWRDAVEGRFPDDPDTLREAIRTRGQTAPLSTLQSLVDHVHARVGSAEPERREAWAGVHGALHQALAFRGSRVALYDLRETVAAATRPLPSGFVTALHAVGDESCLEAIAQAHGSCAADVEADEAARWRQQLESAFTAIAGREKLGARSATMKRVAGRWPALAALSTTSRTTPRPKTRSRT